MQLKFPSLIVRPIAVQFLDDQTVAMFELEQDENGDVVISSEQHYQLVEPDQITESDIVNYRARVED